MQYRQCFICREWSWNVCRSIGHSEVELCLSCYVDVLEVRQARGVMGGRGELEAPVKDNAPGNSPSPQERLLEQLELFD